MTLSLFPYLGLPRLLLFRCALIPRVHVNIYHHGYASDTPGNQPHQEHSHGPPLLSLALCFWLHLGRVLQDFKLPHELSQPSVLFYCLLAYRTEDIDEGDILGI